MLYIAIEVRALFVKHLGLQARYLLKPPLHISFITAIALAYIFKMFFYIIIIQSK